MKLKEIRAEVLKQLFEGYVEHGGGAMYRLDVIVEPFGENTHEVASYLKEAGVIKDVRFFPDFVECSISPQGIFEIAPNYFDQHIMTIISVLGVTGNEWMGMREILDWQPVHDCRARDIVRVMENLGLVETEYRNDVLVRLNLKGRDFYEKHKAQFVN